MPLQRPGERSASGTVGTGTCVHELPSGASGDVAVDLVLDAGAVSQLAIDRQSGNPVRPRYWRTIVGKSCGPKPFFTEPKLLPDGDVPSFREMQVGLDGPLIRRRNPDWELPERRPVLPSHVAHQAPVGSDIVEPTQHHLLRHFHRDIDLCAADCLPK